MTAFTQAVITVAASIVTVAVLAVWRRLHKTLGEFRQAIKSVQSFTDAWTAAAKLESIIRGDSDDIDALQRQLGTLDRDPAWRPLEAYIHEMHHEQKNTAAAYKVTSEALDGVARKLNELISVIRNERNQP